MELFLYFAGAIAVMFVVAVVLACVIISDDRKD